MSSVPLCPDAYKRHSGIFPGFNSETFAKTNVTRRRKREFTPDEQKDDNYWLKRSRNNEAAKRSRMRRRMEERMLETRTAQLLRENEKLKAALSAIHYRNLALKSPFDSVLDYPMAHDASVDPCLSPVADLPLTPFPGANSLHNFIAPALCPSDAPMHHFTPGMDNFFTPLPISTMTVIDTQRRNVGRHWSIPARRDASVTCLPFAYEINGMETHVRPVHFSQNDFTSPFPLNEMAPVCPRPSRNVPMCGTLLWADGSHAEKGGILVSEDKKKEDKDMNEAGRASVSPLLPHKLRYKVNRIRRAVDEEDYNHRARD